MANHDATPIETTHWLSAMFHDRANDDGGEHAEKDAREVDALREAFRDMLEALEMILAPSPHYAATKAHRDRIAEARAKGLAAIAKARGEG